MNQRNNVRYYYLEWALCFLFKKGAITQEEYERASRYNAEILRPDREYIRQHGWMGSTACSPRKNCFWVERDLKKSMPLNMTV